MPAKRSSNFYNHVCEDDKCNPGKMGIAQRLSHLRSFCGIMVNPIEQRDRDGELKKRGQDFFHSPKCCFQVWTDRRISSAVLCGLISQTNKQFEGRSGTSFSRSTSPTNGGW